MKNSASAQETYYQFSEDGKECVIYNANLPTPWLNRLTNDVFVTWVTHRGGIECFLLDPRINGLTNPQETSGFIYVRDGKSGDYFMINRPAENSRWQCAVGLGYNTITNASLGLAASATYFVPRDDNALIILVRIKNDRNEQREIDVFSQVEWNLGDPVKYIVYKGDGRGGSQFNLYKKVDFEEKGFIARQKIWRLPEVRAWPYTGFFYSSHPVTSYEAIKDNFIGPGRSMDNPIAVEQGMCTNTPFWSQDEYPWGVLHNRLKIQAGSEEKLVLVLGMARERDAITQIVRKYADVSAAQKALQQTTAFYERLIDSGINVETPDKDNDRIINIWSKYHWRTSMKKSLNNGLISLGYWTYGIEGSRLSDGSEVFMQPHDLDILKSAIINTLQNQNWAIDIGQLGVSHPAMLLEDIREKWPPENTHGRFGVPHHHEIMFYFFAVPFYLKESGDFTFLEKKIPFIDGKTGTVFEHVERAVAYSLRVLSKRGLALLNPNIGDWMDEFTMVSKEGKGESIMLAMQLCYMLKEYIAIAEKIGRHDRVKEWKQYYDRIKKAVNRYGWDGEWYVRAFADGETEPLPIGTSQRGEGKIYLNSQSWAVLSGVANEQRAQKCLASVENHLLSEFGPMIFYPAYSQFDEHVGVQSTYAPGWRNACIYLRPTGWAIMAACLNNQPDLAYKMYQAASLTNVSKDIERFHCEPYVYPENYVGPDHRFGGQGQFQWCLGEGTNWMWHSYVYYILGIRPELEGLLVDPKIPKEWDGFTVIRPFRGAYYHIEVRNPDHVNMGIKSLEIDGNKIKGNIIPSHSDGKTHLVKVVLGYSS